MFNELLFFFFLKFRRKITTAAVIKLALFLFINVFRCKGSMRYVHVACLNEWRTRATAEKNYIQCPQVNETKNAFFFQNQLFYSNSDGIKNYIWIAIKVFFWQHFFFSFPVNVILFFFWSSWHLFLHENSSKSSICKKSI